MANQKTKNKPSAIAAKWQRCKFAVAIALGAIVGIGVVVGASLWIYTHKSFDRDESAWVFIPDGSTPQQIGDSLQSSLGDFGDRVFQIWKLGGGKPRLARGAYLIKPGSSAYDVARNIKNGIQTPVKITFNNARLLPDVAEKLSRRMPWTAEEFLAACDSVIPAAGFKPEEVQAALIPDTYEAYWTESPAQVASKLIGLRNRFWNEQRRSQAKALGLTPVEVATIASIVEEETAKADERPLVARLYLNRVKRHMKLQADPTVKFALGDFSLRRILNSHLKTESPYNTYFVEGLPPGPIRFVERSTIDAVLNAPQHDYIYMCAKEDFSGYHNFAKDLATHEANARRYRKALDDRGIKK